MPHPHGPNCRCPDLPPDAGLLAYTVDCNHHDQLKAALTKMQPAPKLVRAALKPRPEPERPIDIHPRRHIPQPWEPRPARRAAA